MLFIHPSWRTNCGTSGCPPCHNMHTMLFHSSRFGTPAVVREEFPPVTTVSYYYVLSHFGSRANRNQPSSPQVASPSKSPRHQGQSPLLATAKLRSSPPLPLPRLQALPSSPQDFIALPASAKLSFSPLPSSQEGILTLKSFDCHLICHLT